MPTASFLTQSINQSFNKLTNYSIHQSIINHQSSIINHQSINHQSIHPPTTQPLHHQSLHQSARRILNTGDLFLTLLRDFQISSIDDARLQGLDAYADNPIFRPQYVAPINLCAAKVMCYVHRTSPDILSMHPLNTPYQETFSTHPLNTPSHNASTQHTLS